MMAETSPDEEGRRPDTPTQSDETKSDGRSACSEQADGPYLSVMTLNLHPGVPLPFVKAPHNGFFRKNRFDAAVAMVRSTRPSVLLLQEVYSENVCDQIQIDLGDYEFYWINLPSDIFQTITCMLFFIAVSAVVGSVIQALLALFLKGVMMVLMTVCSYGCGALLAGALFKRVDIGSHLSPENAGGLGIGILRRGPSPKKMYAWSPMLSSVLMTQSPSIEVGSVKTLALHNTMNIAQRVIAPHCAMSVDLCVGEEKTPIRVVNVFMWSQAWSEQRRRMIAKIMTVFNPRRNDFTVGRYSQHGGGEPIALFGGTFCIPLEFNIEKSFGLYSMGRGHQVIREFDENDPEDGSYEKRKLFACGKPMRFHDHAVSGPQGNTTLRRVDTGHGGSVHTSHTVLEEYEPESNVKRVRMLQELVTWTPILSGIVHRPSGYLSDDILIMDANNDGAVFSRIRPVSFRPLMEFFDNDTEQEYNEDMRASEDGRRNIKETSPCVGLEKVSQFSDHRPLVAVYALRRDLSPR